MKTQRTIEFLALIILCVPLPRLHAAEKSIYIKPFAVVQGMPATDTAGSQVKDYISEVVIDHGGYTITSDDEVQQVIEQEEMKMSLDACYDDACIRKLMESIRTDYIIYGTVSFIEEKYYIAAKILDRTTGTVKLSRVKTLEFGERGMIKHASRALGEYLISGNNGAIRDFEEMERKRAKEMHKAVLDQPGSKREKIISRASLMRLGWGYSVLVDNVLREYFVNDMGTGVYDVFLWRQRTVSGNGFDLFMRATFNFYNLKESKKGTALSKSLIDGDPVSIENLEGGGLGLGLQLSWGARYITGWYYSSMLWQVYVSVAYKWVTGIPIESGYPIEELDGAGNIEVKKKFPAHGFVGGIGIELGLFTNFGIFIECTAGYCPAGDKKRNVEGVAFLGGVTLRTKVWRL